VEQDHDRRAPVDGDCSIPNGQVAEPDPAGPVGAWCTARRRIPDPRFEGPATAVGEGDRTHTDAGVGCNRPGTLHPSRRRAEAGRILRASARVCCNRGRQKGRERDEESRSHGQVSLPTTAFVASKAR
jgi:hypothetical protein